MTGAGEEGAYHVQVDDALGRLDERAGGRGGGVVERLECFLDVDLYDGVAAWEREEEHLWCLDGEARSAASCESLVELAEGDFKASHRTMALRGLQGRAKKPRPFVRDTEAKWSTLLTRWKDHVARSTFMPGIPD